MKKTTATKKQNGSPAKDTKLPNINQKGKSPTQAKGNASPNKSKTSFPLFCWLLVLLLFPPKSNKLLLLLLLFIMTKVKII